MLKVFPIHPRAESEFGAPSNRALPAAVVAFAVEVNQDVARLGKSCQHGFTHRAGDGFRQRFAGTSQFLDFFTHEFG